MFDAIDIAGLTRLGLVNFGYRDNEIALSALGGPTDPATDASFAYDDTAFGAVPDGIFKTLTSCAINQGGGPFSGTYVQLLLTAVPNLGQDMTGGGGGGAGGSIKTFTASMTRFGTLALAESNVSGVNNALTTFASLLPWAMPPHSAPLLFLLRPSPLTWAGQDGNQAVRTIWKHDEIGVTDINFTVHSQSAEVHLTFFAIGWQ